MVVRGGCTVVVRWWYGSGTVVDVKKLNGVDGHDHAGVDGHDHTGVYGDIYDTLEYME